MLDDNSAAERPGSFPWCGAECTRHKLTFKSSVKQVVYLTAHTWDSRGSDDKTCKDAEETKSHSILMDFSSTAASFSDGARDVEPFEAEANKEYEITVEWNFTNPNMANDWSVVAWAPSGTLTLKHEDGLPTGELPVIERRN